MGDGPKLLLYLGQVAQLVAALLSIDLEPLRCSTSGRAGQNVTSGSNSVYIYGTSVKVSRENFEFS
jgi:hypothetical protein